MEPTGKELALVGPETRAFYEQATNVAGLCKEIVVRTAVDIQGRKYVPVEAWMTIATAHACIATIKEGSVQEIVRDGRLVGVKAVAEVHRQSDGAILSSAEGYVGDDEVEWFGSHGEKLMRYSRALRKEIEVVVPKKPDYAIRGMAQTRAVSRVCRTAFAHVVVLMNEGLQTTPAEEVSNPEAMEVDTVPAETTAGAEKKAEPVREDKKAAGASAQGAQGGERRQTAEVPREPYLALMEKYRGNKWAEVAIHFGTQYKGVKLGELSGQQLGGWVKWEPKPFRDKPIPQIDWELKAALTVAGEETNLG